MSFDTAKLPNDLCTFWWGLVWRAVKVTVCTIIILWFVGILGWMLFKLGQVGWHHPRIAGVAVALGIAIGLAIWKRRSLHFEVVREVATVVGAKVTATKQRFCPQIDWQ